MRSVPYSHLAGMALLAGAAAFLAGCATTKTVRETRPVEYVVMVRADLPWQNSGITVREGEVLHCLAEGKWSDDFGVYGPAGDPEHPRDNFGVNAPGNGLLLRLSGQTNRVYFIGAQADIVAERSGHVYLRGNAALAPGARGQLKVTLMPAPDADGDGLSDYEEIQLWRTDPRRRDSNGAGFGDAAIVSDRRSRPGGGVLKPAVN